MAKWIEYSKIIKARQSDWKDNMFLIVLTLPILVIAYGIFHDPSAKEKNKKFFEQFQQNPWFTNLWILVVIINLCKQKGT